MYSVVLMAALAANGQTADWGGRQCLGNCYGSCYGNYGIDSYGCYGGGYGNSYTCSGGCGGCYGGGCYGGGYGNSYTCSGGCGGCYGAGYGSCWGSGYGSAYPWDYSSCGCHGCEGALSPYFPSAPSYGPPVVAPTQQPPANAEPLPEPKKTAPEGLAPTSARLIVEAPADAKLYVDDHAMTTQSDRRTYQTPELDPSQTYFYEVRVDLVRDGKTLSTTKRVLVKAGQDVHADFKDMESTATAKAK